MYDKKPNTSKENKINFMVNNTLEFIALYESLCGNSEELQEHVAKMGERIAESGPYNAFSLLKIT